MEKGQEIGSMIDLFPGEFIGKKFTWNLLIPRQIIIGNTISDGKWIEIVIDGRRYITDRLILKGAL